MSDTPNRLLFLTTGTISSVLLGGLIYFFPPHQDLSLPLFSLSPILLFFIFVFISCYSFLTVITKHKVHGLLFAIFGTSYLILRLFHFTSLLYVILLLALFATLEFALSSKK